MIKDWLHTSNVEKQEESKMRYLGKIYNSNNFGKFCVVEYINNKNVSVMFLDTGYVTKTTTKEINNGSIMDRLKPSVNGVGIIGVKYKSKESCNKTKKEYALWNSMLERCYSKTNRAKFVAYDGCSTSENFKRYEFFYEWCQDQVGFKCGYELDKDLLIKGNKLYSENTCLFLPKEVNAAISLKKSQRSKFLIGVRKRGEHFSARYSCFNKGVEFGKFSTEIEAFLAYKKAKEDYLKSLAEKYMKSIDYRAYKALINYCVETTD